MFRHCQQEYIYFKFKVLVDINLLRNSSKVVERVAFAARSFFILSSFHHILIILLVN